MDSGRVKSAAILHNVRVVERNVYGLANKTKKMTHSLEYLLEFKSVKKKSLLSSTVQIDRIDVSEKKHINPDSTFQSTHHSVYFTLFMAAGLTRQKINLCIVTLINISLCLFILGPDNSFNSKILNRVVHTLIVFHWCHASNLLFKESQESNNGIDVLSDKNMF